MSLKIAEDTRLKKESSKAGQTRRSCSRAIASAALLCCLLLGLASCAASDPQVERSVEVRGQYDFAVGRASRL